MPVAPPTGEIVDKAIWSTRINDVGLGSNPPSARPPAAPLMIERPEHTGKLSRRKRMLCARQRRIYKLPFHKFRPSVVGKGKPIFDGQKLLRGIHGWIPLLASGASSPFAASKD
jgi:hypothetical protein